MTAGQPVRTGRLKPVVAAAGKGNRVDGRGRIAETLGKKVTEMNPGQGFAASLVTATLVSLGTLKGYPLSTTHVSVGSLLGIGATTGQAKWKMVGEIMLAWISTVPCGATLSAGAYWLVSWLT